MFTWYHVFKSNFNSTEDTIIRKLYSVRLTDADVEKLKALYGKNQTQKSWPVGNENSNNARRKVDGRMKAKLVQIVAPFLNAIAAGQFPCLQIK